MSPEAVAPAPSEQANEPAEFKIDDPVWVIVDSVNSPTGMWEGEISGVSYSPYNRPSYSAKLTDLRLKVREDRSPMPRQFYGKSPTVNYRVLPRNEHTTYLIHTIEKLEAELGKVEHVRQVREVALLDALARVTQRALTKEEAKAAILEKA